MARLTLLISEAKRLSLAASELKLIEDRELDLTPDQLSDAWEHAYSELYRANKGFKSALHQMFPQETAP
jgi:hypothetical protein